jgi:hypothetical protein
MGLASDIADDGMPADAIDRQVDVHRQLEHHVLIHLYPAACTSLLFAAHCQAAA